MIMENNTVKIFACALALAGMSACSYDSERFGNEAYIAAPEFRQEVKVKVDENVKEMEAVITVAAPRPVEKQMEVTLCSAPELLETYKLAYYDDDVELLPEQNYELGDGKTVFYEGMAEADPFNVKFTNLDKLQYREGSGENEVKKKYILPVRLESAGELPLLESARTMYYVVSEASLINVVADIHDNRAWPVWKNPAPFKDMSAFTMEALVWNDGFTNKEISTVMGIDNRFLVRIGDATLKKNQLNIALAEPAPGSVNRLHLTNDKGMLLKAGRWYHIAVTFDNGIVKAYVNGKEQPEILDATEINVNSVDFTTGVFTGANDAGR